MERNVNSILIQYLSIIFITPRQRRHSDVTTSFPVHWLRTKMAYFGLWIAVSQFYYWLQVAFKGKTKSVYNVIAEGYTIPNHGSGFY